MAETPINSAPEICSFVGVTPIAEHIKSGKSAFKHI
jgi:hypothetical protein